MKRINGLEPSTFCMARTWREPTGADWSRHSPSLCGVSVASQRQQPTATDTVTCENLTALQGHNGLWARFVASVILISGPGAIGEIRGSRIEDAARARMRPEVAVVEDVAEDAGRDK